MGTELTTSTTNEAVSLPHGREPICATMTTNAGSSVGIRRRIETIDPRLPQIAVLGTLALTSALTQDFGTSFAQVATSVAAAVATQALIARLSGARIDTLSPVITGLSLAILLRSSMPLAWVVAPMVGIGGKALLRHRGKHVFNPACLAIVTMTTLSGVTWVSPGQWGTTAWLAAFVLCMGAVVLTRAARWDTAAAFVASYATLLIARAAILGDPWTIPIHQLQSGSLLIFAAFMITDPRSTPDARAGRIAFAVAVAAVGYWLQFHLQMRPGLFYALAACAPLTPLLDRLLPAGRFRWDDNTTTTRMITA